MNGIIYCATNSGNGKVYIGQSVQSLDDRIRLHQKQLRRGSKSHFHCAIRKHGWDSFKWRIIDTAADAKSLKDLEMVYIDMFGTYFNGYNMTLGGDGGGRVITQEHKDKISAAAKGRPCPWSKIGHKHTEETKRRMSASKMGNTIARGRVYINNGSKTRAVKPELLDVMLLEEGWALGRLTVSDETRKLQSIAARDRWQKQRGE